MVPTVVLRLYRFHLRGKPVSPKTPRSLKWTEGAHNMDKIGLFPNTSARARRDIRPGAIGPILITMTVVLRSGQLNTGVQLHDPTFVLCVAGQDTSTVLLRYLSTMQYTSTPPSYRVYRNISQSTVL